MRRAVLAAPAGAKDGWTVDHTCDPIDPSLCLLPGPNDFFTVRDPSTATGRRLNVDPLATPRKATGTPVDPKGVDPHGPDWAQSPEGETAIGHWLQPDGFLPAVCDDHPCYMAGWNGP